MNTRPIGGLAMVVALFAGCGGPSRVLQLGPDAYRVSSEALTLAGAEADVIGAAGRHCDRLGRRMMVTSIDSRPSAQGALASAAASFMCLASDDPAPRRPPVQQAPGAAIEDRRAR